jgi:alginate O-acetyltransferase complex protein AlgI
VRAFLNPLPFAATQLKLQENFRFHISNLGLGLTCFALGLAKKVLFADVLAQYVTPIFNAAAAGKPVALLDGWNGASGFALQLYYDFPGIPTWRLGWR